MRTSLAEVDLKCHAPKNNSSLATDKQSIVGVVLGVKTKTKLATETREGGKTLFKMAAKH